MIARRAIGSSRGFTLLEILVALTIMALVIGALSEVFGRGLRVAESSSARTHALLLAQSKLAEARVGAAEPSGTDGGFAWRFEMTRYAGDAFGGEQTVGVTALYVASVEVERAGGDGPVLAALSTLMLRDTR